MAELNTHHGARQHLHVLRSHVLGPLSTAEAHAEREQAEVAAESEAFEEFADRIEELDAVTVNRQTVPLGAAPDESANQRTEELREAYHDTVMSVPHFEDTYGETLEENVTVEFAAEVAEVFRVESPVAFTPQHKNLLANAARQTARDRTEFAEALDSELASLSTVHRELSTLLDNLDNSIVPAWHRETFLAELDEIQATRQSTLFSRSLPAGYDGHTLCGYLYDDEPWTYPGLTAAARLLDSVVLQEE